VPGAAAAALVGHGVHEEGRLLLLMSLLMLGDATTGRRRRVAYPGRSPLPVLAAAASSAAPGAPEEGPKRVEAASGEVPGAAAALAPPSALGRPAARGRGHCYTTAG
jgi:hypothetical protein